MSVCKGTGTLKARTDFVVSCCWAQKRARDSPPPLFAYTQLHAYLIELAEDSVIVVEPPRGRGAIAMRRGTAFASPAGERESALLWESKTELC